MPEIRLPYPVGVNRLWRTAKGRVILSPGARAWKREAAWRAATEGLRPLSGPVAVEITLHPPLTRLGRPSQRRLDLDAPIKLVLDALEGVAYFDDKQVIHLAVGLGPAITGGGLTIRVMAVGGV